VIFIIRTRGNPLRSRASWVLTATSLAVVALSLALPYTPLASHFGFVPPPLRFYLIVGVMVAVYLVAVELAKRAFYHFASHRSGPVPAATGG